MNNTAPRGLDTPIKNAVTLRLNALSNQQQKDLS